MEYNKVVLSFSGGLDSTSTLLYYLSLHKEVLAISFKYGQNHSIELKRAARIINFLRKKGYPVTHKIIDLSNAFNLSASTLVGGVIPKGDYNEEDMKTTVVENRNIIFSSIIYGIALSLSKTGNENVVIAQGVHSGDHCFTGDTRILTTKGLKTVDELKVGDEVYSFNEETLKTEVDECVDIIKKGSNDTIYNIQTTSGKIRLTSEHKVFVVEFGDMASNGMEKKIAHKLVRELKIGDMMITPNHLPDNNYPKEPESGLVGFGDAAMTRITNIEIENKMEEVYDISIAKNHNFFAGDLGNVLISNSIYPDCRPESVEMAKELYRISNWGSEKVEFETPFVNKNKSEVLATGIQCATNMGLTKVGIKKIYGYTISCYSPGPDGRPCGQCGTCKERAEAFANAGIPDPSIQ